MEGFYTIDNFPIPSTWMAANGGNYGVIATGKDVKTGDILVDEITNTIPGFAPRTNGVKRAYDVFKIQYRFFEVK